MRGRGRTPITELFKDSLLVLIAAPVVLALVGPEIVANYLHDRHDYTVKGTLDDEGLKELAPLKYLTTLYLPSAVTDAGLKELSALPSLTTLYLSFKKVSDKGVETLQQALPNCKISR